MKLFVYIKNSILVAILCAAVADANAPTTDINAAKKGIRTVGEVFNSLKEGAKKSFDKLQYFDSALAFSLDFPIKLFMEASKFPIDSLKSVGITVPDTASITFTWDTGFSGSGIEPGSFQEIMEVAPELLGKEQSFDAADLEDGFEMVFADVSPAAINLVLKKLAEFEPLKDNWGRLFNAISRLRPDTVFFLKMFMLAKLGATQNPKLFPDLKARMAFAVPEMMLLMARLSRTPDPALSLVDIAKTREKFSELKYSGDAAKADLISVLGQNEDRQKDVASKVVYAKKVYYRDPFDLVKRTFETFHLGAMIDESNPNCLKIASAARAYLQYMSDILYKSTEGQIAISIAWNATGGFEGRIDAFEAQVLPLLADEKKIADMSFFDREYLLYGLWSIVYTLPASVKMITDAATVKAALEKRATRAIEVVNKFKDALKKLPTYALPAHVKISNATMKASIDKYIAAATKDMFDRVETMLTALAAVAKEKSGDPITTKIPMIPELSYEATGDVQVPLMSWLKMMYANFTSVMRTRFTGDEGYVADPLPIAYKEAMMQALSIGMRAMMDLSKASAEFKKTQDYKDFVSGPVKEKQDALKAVSARMSAAAARLKASPSDSGAKKELDEAKKAATEAKKQLLLTMALLKGKAFTHKFERVKGGTVESVKDFVMRELVKLFMRTTHKDVIIDALNKFTKPLGVDLKDPAVMALVSQDAQSEMDKEAASLTGDIDDILAEMDDMFPADDDDDDDLTDEDVADVHEANDADFGIEDDDDPWAF